MTISAVYAPDTYAGDGATTTFAITFSFLSTATNVKVSIKVDSTGVVTLKTAATHYNVTGSNVVFTGGNVPATGETIIIELNPDFKQQSDYTENSVFPAETLETDLDERTLEAQINGDLITRSLKFDSAVTISGTLGNVPDPSSNGDKFLKLNSAADGWEYTTLSATAGLANIVDDTTPQLGGNLDTNASNILIDDAKGILDDSSNEYLIFQKTTTAVNYFEMTNSATGNAVTLTSNGSDSTVGFTIDVLGAATLTLGSADATVAIASTITIIDEIQHAGDTNNKIGFTTDTQTFTTGGSTRMDVTDSGIQLGAANARVTTVLDEDTMSSDSATALATQQSIKAYAESYADGLGASQAEMEAATSTAVYVTPNSTQYHPGVSKVWTKYDQGTTAIQVSYNLDSVADNGTGDATFTITDDFSGADYIAIVQFVESSGDENTYYAEITTATTTVRVITRQQSDDVATDVNGVCLACLGDQ